MENGVIPNSEGVMRYHFLRPLTITLGRLGLLKASVFLCVFFLLASSATALAAWRSLAPGLDLGTFPTRLPTTTGDGRITILRIDPDVWDLVVAGIGDGKASDGRTVKEWCTSHKLVAGINAGMFAEDYKTHVGYLRFRDRTSNRRVNKYQSVAAFDPRRAGLPRFRIFDLDVPGVSVKKIIRDYASAVQNLRLIKRPGLNRWSRQKKKWSEAALGEDKSGRILFVFCRSPFTMHDLNRELLRIGIGLVCAQHLEGGPPAQLYLKLGKTELDLVGSYETAIREDDRNTAPWPIPHVLGIRPR
jgi:Phosphodiester glycosidase